MSTNGSRVNPTWLSFSSVLSLFPFPLNSVIASPRLSRKAIIIVIATAIIQYSRPSPTINIIHIRHLPPANSNHGFLCLYVCCRSARQIHYRHLRLDHPTYHRHLATLRLCRFEDPKWSLSTLFRDKYGPRCQRSPRKGVSSYRYP